jgi:hypothetical protein
MWIFALQFVVSLAGSMQAQVLSNRTPDKAKVYASPTPTPAASPSPDLGALADPLLVPPDVRRPPMPVFESEPAYYITLRGVNRLLVSDAHGRVDDLFPTEVAPKLVDGATYNPLGEGSYQIILGIHETYSITFESNDQLNLLEILKGRGNTSPDEAIRYRDPELGRIRGRIQIGPQGVGPLRVDTNRDGTFDLLIKPTVSLRGLPARDTRGPLVKFKVIERSATSMVMSIEATDKDLE